MFHLRAGSRNTGYNSGHRSTVKSQAYAGALVVRALSSEMLYMDVRVSLSTRLCFRDFTDHF